MAGTPGGTVYAIGAEDSDLVKIGFTGGSAEKRLADLQIGSPLKLRLLAEWPGEQETERALHRTLTRFGAHSHGEWFRLPNQEWIAASDGWEAARVALALMHELVKKTGGWHALLCRAFPMLPAGAVARVVTT